MTRTLYAIAFVAAAVLLAAATVHAAPFVVSDPAPAAGQQPTHCGILLDSAAKVDVPVASDATGKYCKYDVGSVSAGSHTVKATFVVIDSVWGRLESPVSAPFAFTRPVSPAAPGGFGLVP